MQAYGNTFEQRSTELRNIKAQANQPLGAQINQLAHLIAQIEAFIEREQELLNAIPEARGPLLDSANGFLRSLNNPPVLMPAFNLNP